MQSPAGGDALNNTGSQFAPLRLRFLGRRVGRLPARESGAFELSKQNNAVLRPQDL